MATRKDLWTDGPLCAPTPLRVRLTLDRTRYALRELNDAIAHLGMLDPRLQPAYYSGLDHLKAAHTAAQLGYRALLAVDPTAKPTDTFAFPMDFISDVRD